VDYHDNEWGNPQHDDQKLFEAIILDGFQAGLSWITILKLRESFRAAFDNFDAHKIAKYNESDTNRLLNDSGIIRNKQKINAAVSNAKVFLAEQEEFGTFDNYIWQFTQYTTIVNHWNNNSEIPTESAESIAMSKDMKKRGFKFCGPVICCAFMQATGMINDHLTSCFKH
jgi:DNA-3-methyladenine glycosylase I